MCAVSVYTLKLRKVYKKPISWLPLFMLIMMQKSIASGYLSINFRCPFDSHHLTSIHSSRDVYLLIIGSISRYLHHSKKIVSKNLFILFHELCYKIKNTQKTTIFRINCLTDICIACISCVLEKCVLGIDPNLYHVHLF